MRGRDFSQRNSPATPVIYSLLYKSIVILAGHWQHGWMEVAVIRETGLCVIHDTQESVTASCDAQFRHGRLLLGEEKTHSSNRHVDGISRYHAGSALQRLQTTSHLIQGYKACFSNVQILKSKIFKASIESC